MMILDLPRQAAPLAWLASSLQLPSVHIGAPNARNEDVRIFIARASQRERAADLVRRRYAGRGYRVPCDEGEAKSEVTLVAQSGSALLGTLTVRPGGTGLLAALTHAVDVARLRATGHRLGEVVKLAIEQGAPCGRVMDALVHSAYTLTYFVYGLTDVIIEVNPRHVRFYEQTLGFVVEAGAQLCGRVGAPSVLLRLDLAGFGRRGSDAIARS